MNRTNTNVYVVGAVENPESKIIRIVHISETMGYENLMEPSYEYSNSTTSGSNFNNKTASLLSATSSSASSSTIKIPYGHILIHTGDFGKKSDFVSSNLWHSRLLLGQIDRMTKFFSKLPHPHKIYVPCGKKDSLLTKSNTYPTEIRKLLSSVVHYLDDDSIDLCSMKIHATSCSNNQTNRRKNSRSKQQQPHKYIDRNDEYKSGLSENWFNVPDDTNILISRDSPWEYCAYNNIVQNIKPLLHLYGRKHGHYGVICKDNVVFSNASYQSFTQLKHRQHRYYQNRRHGNYIYIGGGRCHGYYYNHPSYPFPSSYSSSSSQSSSFLPDCFNCMFPRRSSQNHYANDLELDRNLRNYPPQLLWHTGDTYEPLIFDVYMPPRQPIISEESLSLSQFDDKSDDDNDEKVLPEKHRTISSSYRRNTSISSLSSACSMPIYPVHCEV